MPYEPKFKTGQFVERNNRDDVLWIIIGSYQQISPYSEGYGPYSSYDDSDEHHVMYLVYQTKSYFFDWAWETKLELYCKNIFKGKTRLLEIKDRVIQKVEVKYGLKVKFIETFLTPPERDI